MASYRMNGENVGGNKNKNEQSQTLRLKGVYYG